MVRVAVAIEASYLVAFHCLLLGADVHVYRVAYCMGQSLHCY